MNSDINREKDTSLAGTQSAQRYFIDQERIEEMVRLNRQGNLITEAMGGILPEQTPDDIENINDFLDIACGPGEWAHRVAREYPNKHIIGLDNSQRMIEYANVQSEAEGINASFLLADVTKPLDFADASFDLVNLRMIMGFMAKASWVPLFQECLRVLRPGGQIRVTEHEKVITNDELFLKICRWGYRAFQVSGRSFSPVGSEHFGITVELKPLLRQAGFSNLRHVTHALDFSYGNDAHDSILENFIDATTLSTPLLTKLGITTKDEIDETLLELRKLIGQPNFTAYWSFMTITGRKPGND